MLRFNASVCALLTALSPLTNVAIAQQLETETARLLPGGAFQGGGAVEFQASSDGHETAIPLGLEYGITDRLELMVEPVAYTAIRPSLGTQASGFGDIETTLTYLVRKESPGFPALALAGEVKLPTARNTLIGTGQTDYAAYLIGSKRFGKIDTHANLGYTLVGKPAGSGLGNIANFAVAAVYSAGLRTELFGEVLGNTTSAPGTPPGALENSSTPEAAGGMVVGSIGAGYYLSESLFLSLGVSVDNNGAVLFRPGFTFRTR